MNRGSCFHKTNDPSWKGKIMTQQALSSDPAVTSDEPGAPAAGTTESTKPQHPEGARAVALVLALTAGLSLILALFVGVAVNSGPNGVNLAVAGPPAAIEQIKAGISQQAGPDAFDVTVVADGAAARSALEQRTADGAIVIGADGPTVLTASAGSPAIAQLLTGAAAHLANPTTAAGPAVVDVVALPTGDSRGLGLASGSFPMIIAGLALGAACAFALRNKWVIISTTVGGAVAIGVSFAGIFDWLGVSGGHFLAEASAIALTVATGALLVAGLARLLGAAGIGVGALILLLIGNPLSGIATSPRFLPAPWGELGQWLPTGAGGTLLRTVSYFPEASVAWPMTILLGWALLGALGVIFGRAAIGHGSGAAEIAVETPGRHEAITV
jgi:hypothetical protein